MRRTRFSLFVLALVLCLAGCGGTASLGSDDVAVVGSQKISKTDFDALIEQAKKNVQRSPGAKFPTPGSPEYEALKAQAIQILVQRAEFDQKAKQMGITVSSKEIDQRLAQYKKQYYGGSEKKYRAGLKAQGFTDARLRDVIKSALISQKLQDKIGGTASISDKQIVAYYKSHKSQFGTPPSRLTRHILVPTKAEADKIYAQLQAGADFAALAKKYSKDPGSAAQGGKYLAAQGSTLPEYLAAAFRLKTNEISKPVHSSAGWHVIQALGPIRKGTSTPLTPQLKEQIRQTLEQQTRVDRLRKWYDDTTKSFCSKIKYQKGYAPPPAQDPCQRPQTSVSLGTSTSR